MDLKTDTEGADLIQKGRAFHKQKLKILYKSKEDQNLGYADTHQTHLYRCVC